MILRKYMSFIFFLSILSCKVDTKFSHYPGPSFPDSTPMIFAPEIVSVKGRLEHGISFTPDNKELAFGILKEDGGGEIFYASKPRKTWTEPEIFTPLIGESTFLPYFSPDGKYILYAKTKPDSDNYITDIWQLNKVDSNWRNPELINTPVSTNAREASACMTLDNKIYFSSNRNCEGKENCFTADLFVSSQANNYRKAEEVIGINSPSDEESVFISPQEEYIILCRYTDNLTGVDLYISYRDINKKWSEPQTLDSTINSKFWDRRPFVSSNNEILFFTQLQVADQGVIESDIYWVSTNKLFAPFVFNSIENKNIKAGNEYNTTLPSDYFKDIDNNIVEVSIDNKEVRWVQFNYKNMLLTMKPTEIGEFDIVFTAVDKYSNSTSDTLKINVSM